MAPKNFPKLRHAFGLLFSALVLLGAPTPQGNASHTTIEQGKSTSGEACLVNFMSAASPGYNATSKAIKRVSLTPLDPQTETANEKAAHALVQCMADAGRAMPQAHIRPHDARTANWHRTELDAKFMDTQLSRLAGLQMPEEGRAFGFHSKGPAGWFGEDWRKQGTPFNYQILANPSKDILVGLSGYGPRRWDGGQGPRVDPDVYTPGQDAETLHWSDVAYLTYAKYSKFEPTDRSGHPGFFYSPPQWIYFPQAQASDRTLQALQSSLNSQFELGLRPKPGLTLPIGTRAYDLLITSPMVGGAVVFLAQHRYRFGPCVISSSQSGTLALRHKTGSRSPTFYCMSSRAMTTRKPSSRRTARTTQIITAVALANGDTTTRTIFQGGRPQSLLLAGDSACSKSSCKISIDVCTHQFGSDLSRRRENLKL
ncbi:uncharacterized protein RHO25_013057 [Cercospora beticola]|uniref:Uncharacterized protein n=1 Tax=Cercospora beticola TaxID=122368 RepID=A0ABZ0P9Q5_CERBT|nr:hypothetical protein RHO25_013057 [Cercospora beticola]